MGFLYPALGLVEMAHHQHCNGNKMSESKVTHDKLQQFNIILHCKGAYHLRLHLIDLAKTPRNFDDKDYV